MLDARRYVQDGYRVVVDVDLEKFFDRVNHDILMERLSRRIDDKAVLRLIRRHPVAGIMDGGVVMERSEGTPQGGPLSPLLANVLLDEVMAGLRPTETDVMVRAFRKLNAEQGVTILLIEHVMRAVMALAGRVYVLHHGEIIAAGTPDQVTRHPKVLESYLGSEAVA